MKTLLADPGEAAQPAQPFSDLAYLLHPADVKEFIDDYWEREPLLIRNRRPDYYSRMLDLDSVDAMLSLAGSKLAGVRVVVDGRETRVSDLPAEAGRNGVTNALELLYARFRSGSTVVLNSSEERCEPLHDLARGLGAELTAKIQANIYVTPARSRGFVSHYDTHDVFVAQVHGSKRWRLAGAPYPLPRRNERYDKSQPEPAPLEEFDLRCGDLLYLPRGTVHSATSNEELSIHVTLGIHPTLWSEVFEDAIEKVFQHDVRFRESLPPGFANQPDAPAALRQAVADRLAALAAQISPAEVGDQVLRRAVSVPHPALRHHLQDLAGIDEVGLDTKIRRRPHLLFKVLVTDDAVKIRYHNKTVRLPRHTVEDVQFLADDATGWFSGRSIPGDLDDAGRLVLVRKLLREGFLTLA